MENKINSMENKNQDPVVNVKNADLDVSFLTKREYFAAMAMQGYLNAVVVCGGNADYELIAINSVQYADALLTALSK